MEALEKILGNRRNVILVIAAYILIVIVVLIFIWTPDEVFEIQKYEEYNEQEKAKEMVKFYLEDISIVKAIYRKEGFRKIFNESYLEYNDITLEEAYEQFRQLDTVYYLDDVKLYKSGESDIYSVEIPAGDKKIKVNIIEGDYPYDYTIAYGSFVDYSNLPKTAFIQSVGIEIIETYRDLDYIEYTLEVSNGTNQDLRLNLSLNDSVYLTMKEGKNVYLDVAQSSDNILDVESDGTERVTLHFKLDVSMHDKIQMLNITNMKVNGDNVETKIEL